MAHVYDHDGYRFVANSDLSGDVSISRLDPADPRNAIEIGRVSGRALVGLVAGLVARERVARIEQQEPSEILGEPALARFDG